MELRRVDWYITAKMIVGDLSVFLALSTRRRTTWRAFAVSLFLYSESSGRISSSREHSLLISEACFRSFLGYDLEFVHLREFDGSCPRELPPHRQVCQLRLPRQSEEVAEGSLRPSRCNWLFFVGQPVGMLSSVMSAISPRCHDDFLAGQVFRRRCCAL